MEGRSDWNEYSKMLDDQLGEEKDKRGRTVDEWERDIKKVVLQKANNTIGMKRIKAGKTRLKSWSN